VYSINVGTNCIPRSSVTCNVGQKVSSRLRVGCVQCLYQSFSTCLPFGTKMFSLNPRNKKLCFYKWPNLFWTHRSLYQVHPIIQDQCIVLSYCCQWAGLLATVGLQSGRCKQVCDSSGSRGGQFEDHGHLGCSAVYSYRNLPTFQTCLLPPSSRR
jgi:hypothetical protein